MGKEPQWQFWSGHKPYLVFSGTSLYFELYPINISFFLARNEYLGVKKLNSPLVERPCILGVLKQQQAST
jgi:hypothetical protein